MTDEKTKDTETFLNNCEQCLVEETHLKISATERLIALARFGASVMPRATEEAPTDGTVFLAHYDSEFGPSVGPMSYFEHEQRFHSWATLTQTGKSTGWLPMSALPKPNEGTT